MADEGEILTLNAAGTSWVDLIPAGVAEGYQAQNTNIEAHINGWDITSLKWNSGTSKLNLEISGIIDDNGLPIIVKTMVELTLSAYGRYYIKMGAGSDFSHRTFTLVTSPGTFDASKMAYYESGKRILNWLVYWDGTNAPYLKRRNPCVEPSPMETMIMPWENVDNILQDDTVGTLPIPAGVTYWNFGSPSLADNNGTMPLRRLNCEFKNYTYAAAFWANRGIMYIDGGFIIVSYTFGNECTIYIRVLPNFAYNVASDVYLLSNKFSASNANFIWFKYGQASDKFEFIVYEDAPGGKYITVLSNAYASNGALQIEHNFVLSWTKSGNDIDMYINGIRQGYSGVGTKTVTGTGITGLNMTKTQLALATVAGDSIDMTIGNALAQLYIQEMIIMNTSNTTHITNFDGTSDLPYYSPTWLSGNKQNWLIDANGNAGFRGLSCETLSVNSVDTGAGQMKTKVIPIGAWDMDATSKITIAHGLTDFLKWRITEVVIISDASDSCLSLETPGAGGAAYGSVYGFDSTNIDLFRVGSFFFASANYNDATKNRGFITIQCLT